ncbi:MAG TPA: cytochrome P450 [Stellaceae bacterium]|nr:cytochrome P450 [Stellaceae bacterium]
MAVATSDIPVLAFDPYARDFIADPYPAYAAMRAAGPVFRLGAYDVWGLARYQEVQAALSDWRSFTSAAGVGLADFRKEKPWRPPSLLLETDPPVHDRTRGIVDRVMQPASVRKLRDDFTRDAIALVDRLVARRRFDGVKDLAEIYPVKVFPDAVGLATEGRENLVPYGDMAFNAFGPFNERFQASAARADVVVPWIMASCARAALRPGSLGAAVYEAVDRGEASEDEASLLVRSFLTAGMDTTVAAIGSALHCFAANPGEWQKLRRDRGLARAAFEEVVRLESPIQCFFRTTARDVEFAGTRLGAGEKMLLFFGSANRDPARFDEPDRFDITRKPQAHVGFGTGIHQCVGQMIARLEGEVLLTALAERVVEIALDGEPVRRFNNSVRGLSSLPLAIRPA